MKAARECTSLEELRNAIDSIDAQIIDLIAQRFAYVKEVVKFKKHDTESIIARERYNSVLTVRRQWAEQRGLDPDVVERIYREMMDYFIREELKLINK